jgi:hypothetical protein
VTAGVLAVSAASGLQAAATTPGQTAVAGSSPPTALVASTRLDDTKAVLRATRTRDATATVRLTVYTRSNDAWHSTGTVVVGKRRGWFWHVVSGKAAVCRFSVSNTPERTVAVRLSVSPSIGCDLATRHFRVEKGRLVAA